MDFICHTADSKNALNKFLKYFSRNKNADVNLLIEKINSCPYEVHLIDYSSLNGNQAKNLIFKARYLDLNQELSKSLEIEGRIINLVPEITDKITENLNKQDNNPRVLVYKILDNAKGKRFIIIHRKNERFGISNIALQILCNNWQLDLGNIPLHAAGILHQGALYLFSGPSRSGKSTIGYYGMVIGDEILDEDQLMIYPTSEKEYSANAWGKTLAHNSAPIQAIFRPIKDDIDKVIPLSPIKIARILWEQSMAVTGGLFAKENLIPLYKRVTEFARNIPGYELHFRESPDFWKLIDEQFPA